MSKRNLALLAATFVSVIYGMTFTIAKDVMPKHIDAFGFIALRVGGTMALFWMVSMIINGFEKSSPEKIERSDYFRIIAAAFFGVALNMLTFFKGLSLTSPISAAVIMVSTPMIVMVLSAILVKEKMKKRMIFGLLLGLLGTALLILYGKSVGNLKQAGLGNFLVLINAISYGYYLIIVKKLILTESKYNPVQWSKEKTIICNLLKNSNYHEYDWKNFCNDIKIRDELRNESFEEVFPEYFSHLKNFIG